MLAACSTSTPAVQARVFVAPDVGATQLGRIAIPTFRIDGRVVEHDRIVRRDHADTMDLTRTFISRLAATRLVVLDRQFVDGRVREMNINVSGLVFDETAPSFGRELGAQTLVVGYYRFDCTGSIARGAHGDFIDPEAVQSQMLRVRGIRLETGQVIFDLELSLDSEASAGRLLPKSLARAAAKRLLARLTPVQEAN